jgi:hypothetical protein
MAGGATTVTRVGAQSSLRRNLPGKTVDLRVNRHGSPSMYTIIGPADGPVTFRTHVAVPDLQPADASRILQALNPFLARLRERAAQDQAALTTRPDGSSAPAAAPAEG